MTDPGECARSGCAGVKESGRASALLCHLLQLERLTQSGCQFHLADLTPEDWMGLEALHEGRALAARAAQEREEK